MSEIDPGRTAFNSPGVGENFARMQAHELAWQVLQANPPPLPQPFLPPLTDEQFNEATRIALERIGETMIQVWDDLYAARVGHIPEADFAALFMAHEPLFEADPISGMPAPNPWLQQLMRISSKQCHDDLQRYARIRARHE